MRALMLFGLITLTALDGSYILVESTQITIVRLRSHECALGAGAVIRVGLTTLCVRETPDEIRDRIQEARE